jgi:hypothetical protein
VKKPFKQSSPWSTRTRAAGTVFSGRPFAHKVGFSLLEVAILIILLTVALVPIMLTMGGQTGSSNTPTVSSMNEQSLIRASAAGSLMERALTGTVLTSNINNTANLTTPAPSGLFDPSTLAAGGTATYGPFDYKVNATDPNLAYTWTLKDVSYDGATRVSPKGNRVVKADLQIFSKNPTTGALVPKESSSTYLYVKESLAIAPDPLVGVSLVADVSGSMCSNLRWQTTWTQSSDGLCLPYLNDRFHRTGTPNEVGMTLVPADFKLFDDRQLDIAYSLPVDDPTTPNLDNYMQRGVLGMPPEYLGLVDGNPMPDAYCNLWLESAKGIPEHPNMKWLLRERNDGAAIPDEHGQREDVFWLCAEGSWRTNATWLNQINQYVTRFEAVRGSMLQFLMKLERDQELASALNMSLSTFSDSASTVVPMAGPVTSILDPESGTNRPRFADMREKISWFNRYDVQMAGSRTVKAIGATNTEAALITGGKAFDANPALNAKHLIILTDGEPTMGNTNRPYLEALAEAIHKNCRDGANNYPANTTGPLAPCSTNQDQWVTVNVVGFAGIPAGDEAFLQRLATRGGGRYLKASNVTELKDALFILSYDIKRSMILKRVERYNATLGALL